MPRLPSRRTSAIVLVFVAALMAPSVSRADEVLDWNKVLREALVTPPATAAPLATRVLAIVHAAMFDAVNGVDRRFTAIHVAPAAANGASRREAAVEAAYTTLLALLPAHTARFDAQLLASRAAIAADAGGTDTQSILRGRAWGRHVGEVILAWRAMDGWTAAGFSYPGSLDVGMWRPTGAAAFGAQLPYAQPFVVATPSTFRPPPPPSLSSLEYAADFDEVKRVGAAGVIPDRNDQQTESARFWAGTAPTFWNRAAEAAARSRGTSLAENARLFALLNLAVADSIITCWDSKYFFGLWRPSTAIRLASTDGNPLTEEQADWTPLIANPPYPDYYSGHQSITGAAQAILTAYFGNDLPVEGFSEGRPGVTLSWPNFAAAAHDTFMARIWSGIHFRFAMTAARTGSEQIAAHVMNTVAQPLRGRHTGQLQQQ